MGRFLVLIYGDEQAWAAATEEWNAENGRRHRAFLQAAGSAVLAGGEVVPSDQAVSIRGDALGPSVCDGAFVSSPVTIGGFYLLEAADIDHAVELARQIPEASAPMSGVEVRAMPAAPSG
jgi:hypothetical protein